MVAVEVAVVFWIEVGLPLSSGSKPRRRHSPLCRCCRRVRIAIAPAVDKLIQNGATTFMGIENDGRSSSSSHLFFFLHSVNFCLRRVSVGNEGRKENMLAFDYKMSESMKYIFLKI